MSKKQVKEDTHHTIMCLLGLRKKTCCPECGSNEWYANIVLDRTDKEFTDGHVIFGNPEYSFHVWKCNDCEYEID